MGGWSLEEAERFLNLERAVAQLVTEGLALLRSLEARMGTVHEELTALRTETTDLKSDVSARIDGLTRKVEDLTSQLGQVPAEAQQTLADIKADLTEMQNAVGDADGSDTAVPTDPSEPLPVADVDVVPPLDNVDGSTDTSGTDWR